MEVKILEWDSEFFGLPVASIEIQGENSIDKLAETVNRLKDVRLLYVFNKDNESILNKGLAERGAILTDIKTVYRKNKLGAQEEPSSVKIEEYSEPTPKKEMYELSVISGQYSRFRIDPNIPETKFKQLYHLWIENSTNKRIADHVFVAKINDAIAGLVTLKVQEKSGKIGIIAVSPSFQGKGIGKALMKAAEYECYQKGIDTLEVVTQFENIPAKMLYENCDFTIQTTEMVYHWWI